MFCKSNIILFYLYLVKMTDKSISTNQMVMQIYKLVLLLASWKVEKVTEFTQIFQLQLYNIAIHFTYWNLVEDHLCYYPNNWATIFTHKYNRNIKNFYTTCILMYLKIKNFRISLTQLSKCLPKIKNACD